MKKCSLFVLIILSSFFLFSCSKDNNKMPDDLVVVLPDGKEIYLYMPREDAEAILGEGQKDDRCYNYSDLGIDVYYYENLVCFVNIYPDSSCKLKNGLSPLSRKEDFMNAKFYESSPKPEKVYLIDENDNYTALDDSNPYPDMKTQFHESACISSYDKYSAETDNNNNYMLMVKDWWCGYFSIFDKN